MASYSNIRQILENEERPFWRDRIQRIYDYVLYHINSLNLFKNRKYILSYLVDIPTDSFTLILGNKPNNYSTTIYSVDSNSAFIHSVPVRNTDASKYSSLFLISFPFYIYSIFLKIE